MEKLEEISPLEASKREFAQQYKWIKQQGFVFEDLKAFSALHQEM